MLKAVIFDVDGTLGNSLPLCIAALHDMCPAPFAGVPALLEWLKARGVRIGLVTGKGRKSLDITLEHYGIAGYFEAIEAGSPAGPVKTEGIQAVLEKLGVKPDEAIYVGDSPSDITFSRAAGVPAIAAAWAETADIKALKQLNPDALFDSIESFKEYLEELFDENITD